MYAPLWKGRLSDRRPPASKFIIPGTEHVGADALVCPAEPRSAPLFGKEPSGSFGEESAFPAPPHARGSISRRECLRRRESICAVEEPAFSPAPAHLEIHRSGHRTRRGSVCPAEPRSAPLFVKELSGSFGEESALPAPPHPRVGTGAPARPGRAKLGSALDAPRRVRRHP